MSVHTHLARHQSVVEVVRVYEEAADEVRKGFALIASAEKKLNATFALDGITSISVRDEHRMPYRWSDVETVLASLRRDVWRAIVERLELRRVMSVARAKQLENQIQNDELPEITVDNVTAMARSYMGSLDLMLEEAVGEVFEWLRPRRSPYKTNSEFEVGRKVIIPRAVEEFYTRSMRFRPNYSYDQHFVALENVFSMLVGEGGVAKSHRSKLYDAICQAEGGRGETRFFRFRCCKNGNLHLEFKDPALVKRFNQIAGGRRLKPQAA